MELAAASVTRSIELPGTAEEVWTSLATAAGLAGWLGEAVELDRELVPGAVGRVIDGSAVRRLVVTEVDAGRSIGFTWWDEAAPDEASTVTIALAPCGGDGGSTTVTVTERLAGAANASVGAATIGDLVEVAEASWDRRLQALLGDSTLAAACV